MLRTMDIDLQLAREHHAEGERLLAIARASLTAVEEGIEQGSSPQKIIDATGMVTALSSVAQAHFAASMSVTGILLSTDIDLDLTKE
jgi:hypothetical protein